MPHYNQAAPLWDFIAQLDGQASSHPAFSAQSTNPWVNGWGRFPYGPVPHRDGRNGHPRRHPGPPPHHQSQPETSAPQQATQPTAQPESARSQSPPTSVPGEVTPDTRDQHEHHDGHRRGHRGDRHRNAWNNPEASNTPFNPALNGLNALAEAFQSQLFGNNNNNNNNYHGSAASPAFKTSPTVSGDFTPDLDVFDTPSAYIVHASLPGARKSDVGVSWNAETSELTLSGVVHRPGDEELLKALALDERKVGAFERKVRLGEQGQQQVDVEGISAKLEDGVLRVEVPKMEADFVEVRRVDVE